MNLAHIIDDHDANDVALVSGGQVTTYGSLRDQVAAARGGLTDLGVVRGDRVALLLGNSRQFVVAYLATVGVGAVAVPLNPASPAPELTRQLSAVRARAVVVDELAGPSWRRVERSAVPSIELVVTTAGGAAADTGAERVVTPFDGLLAAAAVEVTAVDPSEVAVLMFTSGTAGSPRAAMLTHGNLLANISQSRSAEGHIDHGDVIFGVLPLFHIFGLNVVVGVGLSVGATLVLLPRFDPAAAVESIRDRRVTVIPGAPALWAAFAELAEIGELAPDTFATVRLALSGASRLPVSVAEAIRDRCGLVIREGYGLTEAAPVVTTSTGVEPRFGSVGRSLDGVEVRLVNAGGDVLVGDVGEVWVRGANVFAGYFEEPEATSAVLDADGWLHTGDMATVDDDGYLYLVDRAKDLIIVSGFNVFPAEVEEVLAGHPDIVEAGVVGVADPRTGEAVKAYVVASPGAVLDEESVIDYALDHLARYKCPSVVVLVDELPRNAAGKLVRRRLDDLLGGAAT